MWPQAEADLKNEAQKVNTLLIKKEVKQMQRSSAPPPTVSNTGNAAGSTGNTGTNGGVGGSLTPQSTMLVEKEKNKALRAGVVTPTKTVDVSPSQKMEEAKKLAIAEAERLASLSPAKRAEELAQKQLDKTQALKQAEDAAKLRQKQHSLAIAAKLAAQETEALNQAIKENRRAMIGIDLEIVPLQGNAGMIEGLRIKQFKPGFSPLESVSYLNENEVLKVGDLVFRVDDDGIDDDANDLLAGMSPELALSKIQGPVGSWLDLTVKRKGTTGGVTIIRQARVIRELKYIVKEGEGITAPGPAKTKSGVGPAGFGLGLLVAVVIWFLTMQGCIHANCAPGLSYVGSPSALYKNSNPKNVPGAIWLGKVHTS